MREKGALKCHGVISGKMPETGSLRERSFRNTLIIEITLICSKTAAVYRLRVAVYSRPSSASLL